MNARYLVCFLALMVSLGATQVIAQTDPPPVMGHEFIDVTIVPGQPYERYFPNHPDLKHPKDLVFKGFAEYQPNPAIPPQELMIWFDWVDTAGSVATSPPVTIPLDPFTPTTPLGAGWTIPFCPPQVSLHFELKGDATGVGQPVVVRGEFWHTCRVPEPSSIALAGLSLAGAAVVAVRRRNR